MSPAQQSYDFFFKKMEIWKYHIDEIWKHNNKRRNCWISAFPPFNVTSNILPPGTTFFLVKLMLMGTMFIESPMTSQIIFRTAYPLIMKCWLKFLFPFLHSNNLNAIITKPIQDVYGTITRSNLIISQIASGTSRVFAPQL